MISNQGKLRITINKASLTRDTEDFGKMDVYVKLKWKEDGEDKEWKSKVLNGAGKEPDWGLEATDDNSLVINVQDIDDSIKFFVLDEDVTTSDTVGSMKTEFSTLAFN